MTRFVPSALVCSLLASAPLAAANIVVDTTADTATVDGFCSLREAIDAANANASTSECAAGTGTSDRILFDLPLPATITLTSHLPLVTESVALVGPGVDDLTIDGADLYRLIRFDNATDADPWFVLSGLTLTDGLADGGYQGGALYVTGNVVLRDCELSSSTSTWYGGGLFVSGTATIERCRILGNSATGPPGAGGISIAPSGSLTLVDSTIAGNTAPSLSGGGGGIWASSATTVIVRSSTISGNSTGGSGGGIEIGQTTNGESTSVTIESSTIVLNQCQVGNVTSYGCGGGLRLVTNLGGQMVAEMRNTIVAGNTDAEGTNVLHDLFLEADAGLTFDSLGFNWVGDNRGAATAFPVGSPNGSNDFAGDGAAALDPDLDALAFNGGPTPTHAPSGPSSPILDQGSCQGALADQRGFGNGGTGERIVDLAPADLDDGCDIGAVEASLTQLTPSLIFTDGFESGRLLFWSADVP